MAARTEAQLKQAFKDENEGRDPDNPTYSAGYNAWLRRQPEWNDTQGIAQFATPENREAVANSEAEANRQEQQHRTDYDNAETNNDRAARDRAQAEAAEQRARAVRNSTPRETFNPNNAEADALSLRLPSASPKVTGVKSTLTEGEEPSDYETTERGGSKVEESAGEETADIDTTMNKPEIKETVAELGIDPDREVPPTTEEIQGATQEAAVKAEAIGADPETVDAINKAAQGKGSLEALKKAAEKERSKEEEEPSEYEKAKAATDSDYKMSKWDRLSKILTVVSAFVHVISEGTIPAIDFTEFSKYNQKKEMRDQTDKTRFGKDLGTEAEITDMLGEIQKGRAWDEEKTKEVQNIIIQEGLQEKIKEAHPDWNKEQIMQEAIKQAEDTFQRRNAAANTEGTAAGNADLGTRLRDQKFAEHCSPKEAQETIQQIDEQIHQIDEAIINLKDKQFDKGISIYNSMVTLFSGLGSTASTDTESTSASKSQNEGRNDGFNGGVGAGPINVGGSVGSQAGTSQGSANSKARTVGRTEANREGIGISAKLSDDYTKNTDADYKKAIANLEAMKKDLLKRRKQFETKASQYGSDNNVTNINNSDVRKKHVYIPKEKRLKR